MTISNGFPKEMVFDKSLNEEELELVRREYQKILSIGKMQMDNISYQLFLDKKGSVYFPKGTLIHETDFSLDILENISKKGLLALEFLGKKKTDDSYYCVNFYKMEKDILLSSYWKKKINSGLSYDKIAFVINPTSKIGGLLYYDLLDSKFDNNPIVKNIIPKTMKDGLEKERDGLAVILAGVPANAISGIILGNDVLLDDDIILKIKRLFPNSYLITSDGNIIRDRSNIIKVDDYENIALKYSQELVKNKLLKDSNTRLKKDIKDILMVVKNNTTFFEQARIYKDLNYKIPKGLTDRLSDEEKEKLKEK